MAYSWLLPVGLVLCVAGICWLAWRDEKRHAAEPSVRCVECRAWLPDLSACFQSDETRTCRACCHSCTPRLGRVDA